MDVAGPLVPAKDIGGLRARWMLVGTLTWAVPAESDKLKKILRSQKPIRINLSLKCSLKKGKKTRMKFK